MLRPLLRGTLALLLTPLLVLLACSDDSDPDSDDSGSSLETTELTVGIVPVLGVAPLYIAIEKGYFEDEGLTIKSEPIQSGATAINSLIGGSFDLLFTNYISLFRAQAEEIAKFRVIAESSSSAPNSFGIYAMPESPITDVKQLEGKKIGVNALNNIATVLVNETLRSGGVEVETIEYIDRPFPEMGGLMEAGEIDAAMLPEPFITLNSTELGIKRIADAGIGTLDGLPIDGWATTEDWAKQNPNTAAAFQRAVQRAAEDAADRSEVETAVQQYTEIPEDVAKLVATLNYPTTLNDTRLQRVADLMIAQGLLEEELVVKEFIGLP